jgi:hypothetical protein
MNRRFLAISLFGLLLCASGTAQQNLLSKTDYASLVERVQQGDKTVDFRALRLAYADSPDYSKRPDTSSDKKTMFTSFTAKDYGKAIKSAEIVLAANYVDMDAHFVEYVAHRELQHSDQAEFHKFVLDGLLRSITSSGDGKTPETALQVIEVHEEYVLLRFMGVGLPESQSLLHQGGHSYDQIKFKDPKSGKDSVLYFNVDIPIKHGQ